MKITLSDEQRLLLETAQSFFIDRCPIEKTRKNMSNGKFDQSLWQEMVELGWAGVNIPEEFGGLGLGIESLVPIVESMGRFVVGSPIKSTAVAAGLISSFGTYEQKSIYLPRIVKGEIASIGFIEENGAWDDGFVETVAELRDGGFSLTGKKCFVTDVDCSSLVLVSAKVKNETNIFIIETSEIPEGLVKREVVIDETVRSFQIDLNGLFIGENQVLGSGSNRLADLSSLLLNAAEMSGGVSGVLQLTVDYLKNRKAFDRLIGSYQSLKHPMVDILISSEALRSHLYYAANCLSSGPDKEAEIAIRMASASGSEAFAYASDRAIQFHGGFGFTYDCNAQLYMRRALWCQYQGGDQVYQKKLLETLLLD